MASTPSGGMLDSPVRGGYERGERQERGPDLWDVWTVSQVQAYSIMILTTFVCFYLLAKFCRRCFRSIFQDEQFVVAEMPKVVNRGPKDRRQNSMSMGAVSNHLENSNHSSRAVPNQYADHASRLIQ